MRKACCLTFECFPTHRAVAVVVGVVVVIVAAAAAVVAAAVVVVVVAVAVTTTTSTTPPPGPAATRVAISLSSFAIMPRALMVEKFCWIESFVTDTAAFGVSLLTDMTIIGPRTPIKHDR